MKAQPFFVGGPLVVAACLMGYPDTFTAPAAGPLQVSEENPRYFSEPNGNIVYLTGAHTWNNLQDMGPSEPPERFDYEAYLDFLDQHHHNFIRLWRWELTSWNTAANREKESRIHNCSPHPWPRTGPGTALDGKPKFDLSRFNEDYFERLRRRTEAAGERGVYVAVMLFEGWGLQFVEEGWKAHPFHPANNINGLDGDANGDGSGVEIHSLGNPEVMRVQEEYVRKAIDTVNDLDNVLYEISNENHPGSTEWQYHMIRYIQEYEKSLPQQHPVGMTFQYKGGENSTLFESPAAWISPNRNAPDGFDYRTNPPAADGSKLIVSDTDHLWGIGGNVEWVWKSFLRGLNPIFMDPYERKILDRGAEEQWEAIRRSLGDTRRFADRINLKEMTPQGDLASTRYCLANPGEEYLIYQPSGGEPFSVELPSRMYRYQWFDADRGAAAGDGVISVTEETQEFDPPFKGGAVLHLKRDDPAASKMLPIQTGGFALAVPDPPGKG